ncbi:tigger transposable element-derived protein 6-like protein [Elysia marginata]|uniref:Tigger transposable element-derived protein 6-like protein n=1 Tax=Elysia marginata TaxID=1093978 RepID=A0AAV4EDZ3_9GAST|nr:tigger transposable element-derived protein 6-like protein [Elysia marginata]
MVKSKNIRKKYEQADMDAALDAVRTKRMSICEAVRRYSVPKTTLIDKIKEAEKPQPRTILTNEEEEKLIAMLIDCARKGDGKTKDQLCNIVQSIVIGEGRETPFRDGKPGYTWYRNFMARHKGRLREKKAMVLGEQRAQVTKDKIMGWFQHTEKELLADGINTRNVSASNIFNMDETGFPFYLGGSIEGRATETERSRR